MEEHIWNFDVTPGGRARKMWPQRVQNPFSANSHVAYQIKGNEEKNTVMQKFCPGGMLGVTRGQKVGSGVPFF